jgi:hypothetical protein
MELHILFLDAAQVLEPDIHFWYFYLANGDSSLNTMSHPFLNGLLWNFVNMTVYTMSRCDPSLGA